MAVPHFELVNPDDLQHVWPLVLPGLEKVRKHSVSNWICEDVYTAIRTGNSSLHLGYVHGEYSGFAVLTPMKMWDGPVLHMWCVYSTGVHDVLEIFRDDIDRLARGMGARRITFWSPRRWERRIKKFGFEPTQVEFVKEIR